MNTQQLKKWESQHPSRFVCYALARYTNDGFWHGEIVIVDENRRVFVTSIKSSEESLLQEQLATAGVQSNFF